MRTKNSTMQSAHAKKIILDESDLVPQESNPGNMFFGGIPQVALSRLICLGIAKRAFVGKVERPRINPGPPG